MTGIHAFLVLAMREGVKVDLHTASGTSFEGVKVTGVQDGVAEVEKAVNKKVRRWVVALNYIEWAVLS